MVLMFISEYKDTPNKSVCGMYTRAGNQGRWTELSPRIRYCPSSSSLVIHSNQPPI